MKKYFIRGFGMGVLFAACVFGISYVRHESDEAVIERAKALGMTFAEVDKEKDDSLNLASPTPNAEEATPDTEKQQKEVEKPESKLPTAKPLETAEPKATPIVEGAATAPPTEITIESTPKPANKTSSKAGKDFSIVKGMWSDKVAEALKKEGLVKDAKEFDKFLNEKGYASAIKVGDYKIPNGASYEEIAKIITGASR